MTDEQAIASEVRAFVLGNLRTYLTRGEGAVEKLLADFAPDLSFIPAVQGPVLKDLGELEAFFRQELAQHPNPISYDVLRMNERVLHEALAVVELAAALAFSETETIRLRGTFVCEKREGRWWIVTLHGSMPSRIGPEELWPLDELRTRNTELEREVAERTDALNAALREAQVEASLERIRSRTMAMQQSSELGAVIQVVFREALALGFGASACDLVILDEETGASLWYIAGELDAEGGEPLSFQVPYFDHPHYVAGLEAWKNKEAIRHAVLEGDVCADYMQRLTGLATEGNVPEEVKAFVLGLRYIVHTEAYMRHGYFRVASLEPLREEEEKILQRFARVFEQTYTRFLDLKQAEEQAREAKIEAALERVRAKAMAMHQSDELCTVVATVYEEFQNLDFDAWACALVTRNDGRDGWDMWISTEETALPAPFAVPDLEDPVQQRFFEAWRQDTSFQVLEFGGEEKKTYDRWLFGETDWKHLPKTVRELMQAQEHVTCSMMVMPHSVLETAGPEALPEEKADVLQRFARVFEQSYTRFLDLKQAEEQAREAQIEAALERVRSRAMAMHSSDELSDVVARVFDELTRLDFELTRCVIWSFDPDTRSGRMWMANPEHPDTPESYFIQYHDHPSYQAILGAWRVRDTAWVYDLHGDLKTTWDEVLFNETELSRLPVEVQAGMRAPDRVVLTFSFTSFGALQAVGLEALSEENTVILQRFARVFDQTYTRFLDLQKAEEQAREAKIEAALERIRARAMAMHHSDELREVVSVMFEEVKRLGIDAPSCCLGIFDKTTRASDWWVASTSNTILPRSYQIPYLEGWPQDWYQKVYHNWEQGIPFYDVELQGDDKRNFDRKMFSDTEFRFIFLEDDGVEDIEPLERMVLSYATFKHGVLELGTIEPISVDQADILQRFAGVIDLTYTRFDDLQQAEALAREATRQASLDRVRGEIASMRTTDDLNRITPLIWRELTTLGVPFFRCGVLIFDEAAESVQAYISNPQGESIGVLTMSFDADATTREAVNHWMRREVYRDLWDRDQFIRWMHAVLDQGLMTTTEHFTERENPPEQLALHFVPFTQGMLYVGSESPLPDEEIDLVQSLADAFAEAYARYEDFRQLEEALNDLKATQNQLIHAEKMASLGQMTAGIAHEIKNPLNFVNNFAEVSQELADELAESLEQGEDVSEILADLKENAGHIARHGKRADSIVRSMMQHARGGSGEKEPVAVNTMVEEYVNLAYHGMRASRPDFNCEIKRDYGEDVGDVRMQGQDIGRVLLNLLGNAFDAVRESGGKREERGEIACMPTVTVSTQRFVDRVEIRVSDNGLGIPEDVRARIFEPFFTTKPTGAGTGLGLSLSYDIVTQGHGGTLEVESETGAGATFIVRLPVKSGEPI